MGKIRQFFGLGPSKREQQRIEQWKQEQLFLCRKRIEKEMFLKLLQTMAETYERQNLNSWYHNYGGWDPGPVVRAYNTTPTEPLFEIHHETDRSTNNWYNVRVCCNAPEFKTIYQERLLVKDAHKPYIDAVFDLVRFGSNGISSETQQNLQKLKNITKGQVTWDNFHEAAAIWHLQQLQKRR